MSDNVIYIDGTNVGINTVGPECSVDVTGDIQTNGDYLIAGKSVLNRDELGKGITKSYLTQLDTLKGLNVDHMTFNGNAIGTKQGSLDFVPDKYANINVTLYGASMTITTEQSQSLGCMPVVMLHQKDKSEPFVEYLGDASYDDTCTISICSDETDVSGYIKIKVNGQTYWMPFFERPLE